MTTEASGFTYEINDLVWAKMKGFPPWPGRVSEPTEALKKQFKKNCKCIFFFGSNNFAWIEQGCLKPYFLFKETLFSGGKTVLFKQACMQIEQYIEEEKLQNNGISENSETRFDSLITNDTSSQPAKKKNSINSGAVSTPNSSATKKRNRPSEKLNNDSSKKINRKPKKPRLTSSQNKNNAQSALLGTLGLEGTPNNQGLTNNHLSPIRKNNSLLDRPEVTVPESTPLDVTTVSSNLLKKKIDPSRKKFGFIGIGNMGSGIVKNLLNSGHQVMIWNRSTEKCHPFEEAGATVGLTPSDVVSGSDVTFSCVADPQVAKDMVFGNCGVLSEITPNKGFIEMSGIDPETSQDIGEAIVSKGGRYVETMIQGSKVEAAQGNLICMSAGDKVLFDSCHSAFNAFAKDSIYLGEVGSATKMNLILHSIKAVCLAGLAEGMALADRAGIPQKDVLSILDKTSLHCALLSEKGRAMRDNNFQTNQALKHIQKDLNLSLNWADTLEQPCPVTASVNEVFKHAKRLGYSDHDTSAVYVRAKF